MPPKKKNLANEMINYYEHIPKKFLNNVPNPQYSQHFIKTMFRMCVCAPSGSGKTTFVLNLLQRFSSGEGTFSKIYIILVSLDIISSLYHLYLFITVLIFIFVKFWNYQL